MAQLKQGARKGYSTSQFSRSCGGPISGGREWVRLESSRTRGNLLILLIAGRNAPISTPYSNLPLGLSPIWCNVVKTRTSRQTEGENERSERSEGSKSFGDPGVDQLPCRGVRDPRNHCQGKEGFVGLGRPGRRRALYWREVAIVQSEDRGAAMKRNRAQLK